MGLLEKNIEAIGKKDRALAERVTGWNGEFVKVEAAKSGEPTFRHMGRLFHSAYDPAKEAGAQAEELASKKAHWVLIFGLGCGHLLKALVEKGQKKVVVYEPSPEILHGVLRQADLSDILALDDVFVHDDMQGVVAAVRSMDGFDDLLCYTTSPYKMSFPKEYLDFLNKVNNAQVSNKVNIRTDVDSREAWIRNYLANIPQILACTPVDALRDRLKGVPLVIAGAGPSLHKNAHLLREARGKAVIIAAITAYKPLLKYGVVPDFIIASEKVDLPEYFAYDENDRETRLILGEVSHPGMFTREVKEKYVFFSPFMTLGSEHAGFFGSDYFPASGGSVTTAALDIGVMLGCSPIVFIGQDLCFGESGTHAEGGVYVAQDVRIDEEKGEVVIEEDYVTLSEKARSAFKLMWLKGVGGKPVPSKFDWVTFHQWFENYLAVMKKKGIPLNVINATEGGAYIEGMEHVPLSQVLERYVKNEVSLDEIIDAARSSAKTADLKGLSLSLEAMQMKLKEAGRFADSILKEVSSVRKLLRDHLDPREIEAGVIRIKRLEERLFKSAESSPFIWEALMEYTYRLKERLRSGPDEGDPEKQIREELESMASSYGMISEVCGRYRPVLLATSQALKAPVKEHCRKDVPLRT
ncbi:MAG: motility associated factor glycosyltransferase family protein [Deltaproteobacteria bacterium]|nr:motility associated factor glycosyltransferase family protein [Deltaproteobacteria bacterium]MBZ0219234.1 DUF115 domain-containing protein [Deltaproteobacteria bacterium]